MVEAQTVTSREVAAPLNSSIGDLDTDRANPHHVVRLHAVPEGDFHSRTEATAILPTTPEAISARRKAVERAVELYVAIYDEPQGVKLNAAVLAALKSMDLRSSGDVRNVFTTIGWVLRLMNRQCAPCRIGDRRQACLHKEELEKAARLKVGISGNRGLSDANQQQLGSTSTRRRMTKSHVKIADARRKAANAAIPDAARERGSIIRRASYAEACELFYRACVLQGRDAVWCVFGEAL